MRPSFYLTGRLTRFAKVFGRRISLEDVEDTFERQYASKAAVIEADDEGDETESRNGEGNGETIDDSKSCQVESVSNID